MSGALRQIFALFDVQTGDAETKLEKLNERTSLVKSALGALATTALGAFSFDALKTFIEDQIEVGSALNDMSEKLGVGTDELQRFQYAAASVGVGAEEAGKALQFLNKNMGDALEGGDAAKQFAELGVQTKDAEGNVRELGDVIPEVADAFEKMGGNQERTVAAMKLFGKSGASLIPLLKNGSAELSKMNEEFTEFGLGIDEDFIKKADEAGDTIDLMKWGVRSLKTRIAAEMLPSITDAAKKLAHWVAEGKKLTKETHIVKEGIWGLGIVSAITAGKMVHSWMKVIGLFKGGSPIANMFAMGKLGLTIGAVLLLAGAIEDIVVMCQGGESVIGSFLDRMLGVEERQKLVESLNKAWEDVKVSIDDVGPAVKELGTTFAEVLPVLVAMVVDLLKVVGTLAIQLMGLGEFAGNLAKGDFDRADQVAAETADKTANLWKTGSTTWKLLNAPAQGPDLSGTSAPPGVLIGPPVEMNATNYFQIHGATDPAETGRRIAGFQREVNQDAINDAANSLATGTE